MRECNYIVVVVGMFVELTSIALTLYMKLATFTPLHCTVCSQCLLFRCWPVPSTKALESVFFNFLLVRVNKLILIHGPIPIVDLSLMVKSIQLIVSF